MCSTVCTKEILNRRRGRWGFRTLCCDVFGLLKNQCLRNKNNKVSRSNVNKHELVYGESSPNARNARCLFIICVIVYNLYYCCYAKTISSAVQKRHSKVYGNRIAPSFYLILLDSMYLHCKHCLTRQEECTNDWNLEIRISVYQNQQESLLIIINNKNIVKVKFK